MVEDFEFSEKVSGMTYDTNELFVGSQPMRDCSTIEIC